MPKDVRTRIKRALELSNMAYSLLYVAEHESAIGGDWRTVLRAAKVKILRCGEEIDAVLEQGKE